MKKPLFKTTVIIWTEYDPHKTELLYHEDGLEFLMREASSGNGYCSNAGTIEVIEPTQDPDWDGTDFFNDEPEEEEEESNDDMAD